MTHAQLHGPTPKADLLRPVSTLRETRRRPNGALPLHLFDAPIGEVFPVAEQIWRDVVEGGEGSADLLGIWSFPSAPGYRG